MKSQSLFKIVVPLSLLTIISACSSSGDDNSSQSEELLVVATEAPNDDLLVVSTGNEQLTIDGAAQDMLNSSDFEPPGDASGVMQAQDRGDFLPTVFDTETDVELVYALAGAALVESFNEAIALPADIAVNFIDCDTANAFYAPPGFNVDPDDVLFASGGAIFMCHELTALLGQSFEDTDRAFAASVFVLMHEIGHALVNQLQLPVLGIEESYVDGVAAVLVGESGLAEASVFAGFFFGQQTQTPFFDSHRAGPQRLGDLACWGVGADSDLLQDSFISLISQQLVDGGRDCVGEYTQQVSALQTVLGPYIRGGLTDTLDSSFLPQSDLINSAIPQR